MGADFPLSRGARATLVAIASGLVVAFSASPSVATEDVASPTKSAAIAPAFSEQGFPNDSDIDGWDAYAKKAADFDSYRITDSDLNGRRSTIERYMSIRQKGGANLDSQIEAARVDFEKEKAHRDELEPEASRVEGRLSAMAMQHFKLSGTRSSLPLEASASSDVKTRRRTKETFDRTVDESASDYKVLRGELDEVVERYDVAAANLNEVTSAKELHTKRLKVATKISDDFHAAASQRDATIAKRSADAIAGEKAEPQAVVGVFTVHQSIAEPLTRLLEDAAADGIEFAGWGQRPVHRQIELRRGNCGTSEWAMFDKSSGSCSPPTARPGHSQHELGLAIDFTEGGSILTRSSPGYHWLHEHAAEYGLKNLPSEPWHWSTTGR